MIDLMPVWWGAAGRRGFSWRRIRIFAPAIEAAPVPGPRVLMRLGWWMETSGAGKGGENSADFHFQAPRYYRRASVVHPGDRGEQPMPAGNRRTGGGLMVLTHHHLMGQGKRPQGPPGTQLFPQKESEKKAPEPPVGGRRFVSFSRNLIWLATKGGSGREASPKDPPARYNPFLPGKSRKSGQDWSLLGFLVTIFH